MIATRRPRILELTLASFRQNLFKKRFLTRGIVNIDPIGGSAADTERIVELAKAHFDSVTIRTPESPSFSGAVHWTWSQASTPWVLHLEDDWLLKRPIDVDRLLQEMRDPGAMALRLNLRRNPRSEPPLSPGFSLNPSFFRLGLIKNLLSTFNLRADPEKQFRGSGQTGPLANVQLRFHGAASAPACVIDIGKKWRRATGFIKHVDKSGNTEWLEKSRPGYRLLSRWKSEFFIRFWQAELMISRLRQPV